MGRLLRLYYSDLSDTFDLLPGARWPVQITEDELYEFRLQLLRDRHTGQLVGFSNEGGDLARDYERLMALLGEHPIPGRYDVPDLGLTDTTLPEVITAIYERYVVGRKPEITYPVLSIIIPVHNEEHRLPGSLDKITSFLATQPYEYEVIIVENGSTDDTVRVARRYTERFPYIRFYQVAARGKGLAVQRGMLEARGRYRFICDADLSMPVEEVNKFLPPALDGYDVAIASREAPGAVRYDEPWYRHVIGRIFNLLIKLIAVRGFEDTQCGFKSFRNEVAKDLFGVQTLNGIGFDVELLFIAQRRGYRIVEVPIHWYYSAESRMRLVRDSLRALAELFIIRRNWRRGVYAPRDT